MTENVIQFPKMKLDTPPQTLEEISNKIMEYKMSYSDELSELLWNHVLGEMARSGCEFENKIEEIYPSMVLLLETIRSLHLQANDIYHPLQDFAKQTVSVQGLDEDKVLEASEMMEELDLEENTEEISVDSSNNM